MSDSLFLLFFLFFTSYSVDLVEIWDCGTQASTLSMKAAESFLKKCPLVKDSINMCCKDHDYCYETSELTNFTREYCDFRFCRCLHDAEDIHNNNACNMQLNAACKIVSSFIGGAIFPLAHPKNFTKKFEAFVDTQPLGLNMKTLVDECINAKGMAVHCHNIVYRCEEKEKKRNENGTLASESNEDCRSIMYECLQIIGDSNDIEPCPSLARRMAKQVNIYGELSEEKHGKSTIEIYPIISARLIESCEEKESIELCLKSFDACAIDRMNREEKEEYFNAARRVKMECHRGLKKCIEEATIGSIKDKCIEGRQLALNRIREDEYESKSVVKEGASRIWKSISSPFKKIFAKKNSTSLNNTNYN
ncbi:hypothetical protein PRIPAC_75286 [Pristionchus pacificus]|nr:hypothetical protein PRIPAC_75286 [Pristionchus pacificus]